GTHHNPPKMMASREIVKCQAECSPDWHSVASDESLKTLPPNPIRESTREGPLHLPVAESAERIAPCQAP
ncbi:MAG: hypothetical protein WB950_17920, partial [Acidobacteriaceae bacterium]